MLTQYVDGYQHIGVSTDDINKTVEFIQKFESEEEKEKAVKEIG